MEMLSSVDIGTLFSHVIAVFDPLFPEPLAQSVAAVAEGSPKVPCAVALVEGPPSDAPTAKLVDIPSSTEVNIVL